jgi:hypothetical protein
VVGSCVEIPLRDPGVDVAISLETLEHYDQYSGMMTENQTRPADRRFADRFYA